MADLDRISGTPLYRQIAAEIRRAVQEGRLQPGALLPSERSMATQYGVERQTIRRGIQLLINEGVLLAGRGRHTTVRDVPVVETITRRRRPTRDEHGWYFDLVARDWGKLAPTKVYRMPATADVARRLSIPPGTDVVVRDRRIGPMPSGPIRLITTSYQAAELAELFGTDSTHVGGADQVPGRLRWRGIYDAYEAAGHVLSWREDVSCRMPTPEEAAILQLVPGIPVLRAVRTTISTGSGAILDISDFRMGGDRFELGYELNPAPEDSETAGADSL